MIETVLRQTRSSGSQPLPTDIFGGAHSQDLASTSASYRSKFESGTVAQKYEHSQKSKMTLKLKKNCLDIGVHYRILPVSNLPLVLRVYSCHDLSQYHVMICRNTKQPTHNWIVWKIPSSGPD